MVDVVGVGRGRSISCAQVQNALPQIRPFLDELPFCLGLQPQLLRRRLGSRLLSQLLLACCLCCLGCDLLLLVLHEPRCRAVELAGLAPLAGPRKQAHQPIIVLGLLLRLQHVLAQLLLARCFCLSLLVCGQEVRRARALLRMIRGARCVNGATLGMKRSYARSGMFRNRPPRPARCRSTTLHCTLGRCFRPSWRARGEFRRRL